ncbi:MAG: HEAT repeat domain-containing protein [Cyanobacteria bacterium RU_5_0]|nr:HEAT repeat domain-containing protein [Cyanobacteria bacterium RU_5_0]
MVVIESTSVQPLINAIEKADSPERLIGAVRALAMARSEAGIPVLIKVLGYNNPGAAVVAVNGLVQMGAVAVQPLLVLLDDYNYGARAWAIRALVMIADPRALDVLLSAAMTDFAPSVRRAATKGLGMLQWQLLPEAQVTAAQFRVLEVLLAIAQDSDWSIRYAAVVGLQALATGSMRPEWLSQISATFQQMAETESDLAVQARVYRAIG